MARPGEIQITRATYELLKDEFVCQPRGTILVKGKGQMETWYLVGPRSDDRRTESGIDSGDAERVDPRTISDWRASHGMTAVEASRKLSSLLNAQSGAAAQSDHQALVRVGVMRTVVG